MKKIQKFLKTEDPNNRKIDDSFCKILECFDSEEHPVYMCYVDGKAESAILLSPDVYADGIKTSEAKNLQPSTFMTQIADTFFTGPCILLYD
jgi:hypothetical protein